MSTSNGFTQNNHSHQPSLRLVLPSDGDLHEPTLNFMRGCGLTVLRPNARRYTATIPALPGVEVLFQQGGVEAAEPYQEVAHGRPVGRDGSGQAQRGRGRMRGGRG